MRISISTFSVEDAKETSNLIIRNLKEVNSKDYDSKKINELVLKFNEKAVAEFNEKRHTLTARINNKIVGTLSVVKAFDGTEDHYVFLTIFVLPDVHGKGVGKQLVLAGENYIKQLKGKEIFIPSSVSSHPFYHKLGYTYCHEEMTPDNYGCIPMVKYLED